MPLWPPIPGETPLEDFSELKAKGVRTREELDPHEAKNILKTVLKYLARDTRVTPKEAPFDYSWALRLHQEMFGEVWGWAGKVRRHATTIGAEPEQIESRLYDLLRNLPYWKDLPLVEQAAMLHHKAVQIHPFTNGNGRWARMMANIWTFREGEVPVRWPDKLLGEKSPVRDEYIKAIKACDEGDYGALIDLHKRYTPAEGGKDSVGS